jgi:archaellum component FlaC
MLTREDLEQIGQVIDARLESKLEPISKQLDGVEKQLEVQDKDIKAIKRTVDLIGRTFNKDDVEILKRVERIEHHVGLPHTN